MDGLLTVSVIKLPSNSGMEKFKKERKNLFVCSALEFIMFLYT